MNAPLVNESQLNASLADLIEQVTQQLEAGEEVDLSTYAASYPQHAVQLRRLFPALQLLGDLSAAASQSATMASSGRIGPAGVSTTRGTLGDFHIVREIGRGGMGIVYEAEQVSLGRRVALKTLPMASMLDERQLQRFKNEARAAASLHHEHIVPVYAVGCDRGVHYFAMQFINGRSLAEVIASLRLDSEPVPPDKARADTGPVEATLSPQIQVENSQNDDEVAVETSDRLAETCDVPAASLRATQRQGAGRDDTSPFAALSTKRSAGTLEPYRSVARLALDVANALEHAHSLGVVHRDIKPANLLLDRSGKIWVADFGLARLEADAGVTKTGDVVGTLRYMAPEQALGTPGVVDHRADIYALGATLYELLALRPVYDGVNREHLMRQIAMEEPASLRRQQRAVPADVETIVMKALAKDPNDRYASAQAMADDLAAYLADEPIRAKPPTLSQRLTKWASRHKPLLATAAILLVLSTIGLATSTTLIAQQRMEAIAQRNEAEHQRIEAERQKLAAEQNFRLAREAVDTYLTKVSENELLNAPSLQPLRKDLLQLALKYYQEFAQQRHDDPSTQIELAAAYYRMGTIISEVGSIGDAIQFYEKALEIRERLHALAPDDRTRQHDLAESCVKLGSFYTFHGRPEEGRRLELRGADMAEQLVSQSRRDLRYRKLLADAAFAIADSGRKVEQEHSLRLTAKGSRRATTAETILRCRQAVDILHSLTEEEPDESRHQRDLISAYRLLGHLYSNNADDWLNANALASYRQSAEMARKLAIRYPLATDYKYTLAHALHGLANQYWRMKLHGNSVAFREQGITTVRELVEENPTVHIYQGLLASELNNFAVHHVEEGRYAEAETLHDEAQQLSQQLVRQYPDNLSYQDDLSRFYHSAIARYGRAGRFEDAIASVDQSIRTREQLFQADPHSINRKYLIHGYWIYARVHSELGKDQVVTSLLERLAAVVLSVPEDERQYDDWGLLGQSLCRLGRWTDAKRALEKSVELSGNPKPSLAKHVLGASPFASDISPHWHLVMTLHQLGDADAAARYYSQLNAQMDQKTTQVQDFCYWYEIETLLGKDISQSNHQKRFAARKLFINVMGDKKGSKFYLGQFAETISNGLKKETSQIADWGHVSQLYFAAEEWASAREAVEIGIELRGEQKPTGVSGPRWWVLTMALHQLGETETARLYYDQLVAEMKEQATGVALPNGTYDATSNSEWHRQAAALLGLDAEKLIAGNQDEAGLDTAASPELADLPLDNDASLTPERRLLLARGQLSSATDQIILGNDAKARELRTKAIELLLAIPEEVRQSVHWNCVGEAHFEMGDWAAARTAFEKSRALEEQGDADARLEPQSWMLTMVLHRLGETEAARRLYDQLLAQMKEQQESVSEETRIYRRETATLLGLVEDDVLLGPADAPSPKPAA